MLELLCIDDNYTDKQLEIFLKHEIKYPKQDEIVEFLRVDKIFSIKKTGFIVSPYHNQFIKDQGFEREVSFSKDRFVHLDGSKITDEEVKEEDINSAIKQYEYAKKIIKENKDKIQ